MGTEDRGYGGSVNRRRKHWGWGYEDERPSGAELRESAATFASILGFGAAEPEAPVPLERCTLPAPQLTPPPALAPCCDASDHARARRSYGSSYRDVLRGFRGDFRHPPDVVAIPRDEPELERVLEWAIGAGAAVIPYGGGTGVAGGVEPDVDRDRFEGVVTIDLSRFDRVLEVDSVSQTARIGAGATGPWLEHQLREHRLTLRHYPQSYTLATLGGMIATRAGGHFATLWTHIDDLVESVRAITPSGAWESRRLPGSGAGPSPDRILLGSEGILGMITQAWMRVQPRPAHRASRAVCFDAFVRGTDAVRELSQSGLHPANCRLVDELEARQTGVGDGRQAVLVLGFESTDHDVDSQLARALEICAAHGGAADDPDGHGGSVSAWRDAFLAMPYLRDVLLQCGVMSDTFETAITWERFPAFHVAVLGATREALGEPCRVSCRFTHVYPDGPAPYYTVLAPIRRGDEIAQWHEMKQAASAAIIAAGGTITHHHAVGRDHRPWYDEQRPDLFADALRAVKRTLDPRGMLNPGVLV
jgi:alkyldihydroxyacetonephosphate synthase